MLNNIASMLGVGGGVATDYESIATVNGNGSASTLSFTSIPSTYSHLQIRGIGRDGRAVTIDTGYITLNSTSTTTYASHLVGGNGTIAYAGANSASAPINTSAFLIAGASAGANMFSAVIIDVLDYANTNKAKTMRTLTGSEQNGIGAIWLASTLWTGTSAISQIDLSTGTITAWATGTTFALYGIK
jgi:hypothetical protein